MPRLFTRLALSLLTALGVVAGFCPFCKVWAQNRPGGKPDRFIAIALEDATVFRRRDGKFTSIGKVLAGEKVMVLREYKNGTIWAVGNKKIRGFAKGVKFQKKLNIDEARKKKRAVGDQALKEVWEDDTEAEDLLTNRSALRAGLNTGFDREIGLGFGIPVFYGFAYEGRRVELGGEVYFFPFNAGKPLQFVGVARYLFTFGWFEIGPEFFGSMAQLLALDNTRGYGYGAGALIGTRFTQSFQFNLGARANFNGGVNPFYYASLFFTF